MSDVLSERHGPVLLLRLNRPDRNNAIGGTLMRDLVTAATDAAADDTVRVVVTTGVGRAYCVGGDLDEIGSPLDGIAPTHILNSAEFGGEKGLRELSPQQEAMEDLAVGRWAMRFRELEKPSIAAINGPVAGGGLAIALLHDFRWAAASAMMTTGFNRVGLTGEMGMTFQLPRVVGYQRAAELMYTARPIGAEEAAEVGLVDRVLPDEELVDGALEFAAQLARRPTVALQMTKRLLRSAADVSFDEQLRREYQAALVLYANAETREALAETRRRVTGRQ